MGYDQSSPHPPYPPLSTAGSKYIVVARLGYRVESVKEDAFGCVTVVTKRTRARGDCLIGLPKLPPTYFLDSSRSHLFFYREVKC
jgi:hypothetical protein